MNPPKARELFKAAIQKQFQDIVRANEGQLAQKAAEIGAKRQQLQQYATKGTMPGSDLLLTAFIKWGMRIRISDPTADQDDTKWWECGMLSKDRSSKRATQPEQLPLFQAIEELTDRDMNVKVTKKEPGRIRLAVDILFRDKIA